MKNNCPINDAGIKPNKIHFIPVKENGVVVSHYSLKENGKIWNQIMEQTGGELPESITFQ